MFLDEGVDRISIGAQSFNGEKLKHLGRIHDAGTAKKAVELSVKKGFKNISIDLIFGVSGESLESWKKDLKYAVSLPIKHISCYSLTHDKDLRPTDDDTVAQMYKYAIAFLEDNGFKQYEISNFAHTGYQCKHNLNYWEGNPYVGVGPSAVSYLEGSREENIKDVKEYVRCVADGRSPVLSREKLTPSMSARETAAVKIRTKEGINLKWFKEKTGFDFMDLEKDSVRKLAEDGLIEYNKKHVRLTKKGILFCDIVSSAFV